MLSRAGFVAMLQFCVQEPVSEAQPAAMDAAVQLLSESAVTRLAVVSSVKPTASVAVTPGQVLLDFLSSLSFAPRVNCVLHPHPEYLGS